MKRFSAIVGLAALLVLGCGSSGVGDPCAPTRPAPGNCTVDPATGEPSPACFRGTEVYIETQALQCRSRICLVYQFSEAAGSTAADRAQHVYCTCRCGVPPSLQASTDESVLCACPENFSCVSLAGEQYNPGVRGSYCVRSGASRDQ